MRPFPTLDDALGWISSVYVDDRPVPMRLHDMVTDTQGELGTPRLTAAFVRWLTAKPADTMDVTVTVDCPSVSHSSGDRSTGLCPICMGRGTYDVVRRHFRYPMWRALKSLAAKVALRPGHPTPIEVIAQLAAANWIPTWAYRIAFTETGISWDAYEALALMALRDLHRRYALGPVPRRVQLSESQQIAEAIA